MNKIAKFLDRNLPTAKYSNGKDAKCILFRLCTVFDITDD